MKLECGYCWFYEDQTCPPPNPPAHRLCPALSVGGQGPDVDKTQQYTKHLNLLLLVVVLFIIICATICD